MTGITLKSNLNPPRRHRTCPRAIKRTRPSPYRVKTADDHSTRHHGPPAIRVLDPKPQATPYSIANPDPWQWIINKPLTCINTS